jgi:hypothetical protein
MSRGPRHLRHGPQRRRPRSRNGWGRDESNSQQGGEEALAARALLHALRQGGPRGKQGAGSATASGRLKTGRLATARSCRGVQARAASGGPAALQRLCSFPFHNATGYSGLPTDRLSS